MNNSSFQKGSALIYILIGIALIGTLTATMLNGSNQSAASQKSFQLAHKLEADIKFIEAAIQECIINYPDGDPTVNSGPITDAGYIAPYPLHTDSDHFIGSTLGKTTISLVSKIRCPGDPGLDNNHAPIFDPAKGMFFPKPASNMGDWGYFNMAGLVQGENVDGVYIQIPTAKSDMYIRDAMMKLENKYPDCKLDYIVGDGTNGCVNDRYCIRYWLVRNSPC
jgi:hypothetical protein